MADINEKISALETWIKEIKSGDPDEVVTSNDLLNGVRQSLKGQDDSKVKYRSFLKVLADVHYSHALYLLFTSTKEILEKDEELKSKNIKLWEAANEVLEAAPNCEQFHGIFEKYFDKIKAIGVEIPKEFYEDMGEFMVFVEELEKTEPKTSTHTLSEQAGAIMNLQGKLSFPSTENLMASFSGFKIKRITKKSKRTDENGKQVYIPFEEAELNKLFDENGELNGLTLSQNGSQEIAEISGGFLGAVLKCALEQMENGADFGQNIVKFNVTGVCRDLKIDGRKWSQVEEKNAEGKKKVVGKKTIEQRTMKVEKGQEKDRMKLIRANALLRIILPFNDYYGTLPNGSFYKVLTAQKYDKDTDIMEISSPYIFEIAKLIHIEREKGKIIACNEMLRAEAFNSPPAALEIANRIIIGLINRGQITDKQIAANKKAAAEAKKAKANKTKTPEPVQTPEADSGKITFNISYQTIIEECPMIRNEIETIVNAYKNDITKQTRWLNKKLKDRFTQAFKIIYEKSDVYTSYEKISFNTISIRNGELDYFTTPTKKTLNGKIVVTHYGKK